MGFLSAQHLAPGMGTFEPQRTYNWSFEVALDDVGDQLLIMQGAESFSGPKESNEEIELNFANETRYVAGKAKYEANTLVLKDFVDQGTANAVIRWRRLVYNPETGSVGLATNYKKNADLQLTAPDGTFPRIWKFIGCWPQSVEFGDLDVNNSEKQLISINLRYDRAVPGEGLNDGLGGVNVGEQTAPI